MAWKTLLATALAAGVAGALRTSFSIQDLQAIADDAAALETKYRQTSARAVGLGLVGHQRRDQTSDIDPSLLYPAYNLTVPIDHFHNDSIYEPHTNDTFDLRYWFDASHYRVGGPVIVLQSGETSGVNRLPFLQKGIVSILAEATGGLGVILEHRYYGTSFPFSNLSTENMRFLTTDQAVADMAYFAKNVEFEGLEDSDLTSPNVPYIAYGGSYAGVFVALLRKLYPDVYWGAISSSGVTQAIIDYWQYYEAARLFVPGDCVVNTQKLTHVIDNILIGQKETGYVQRLKDAFGLGKVTNSTDFASSIAKGIEGLQGTNWDPAENDTTLGDYCDTITNTSLVYDGTASKKDEVLALLNAGGYAAEADTLTYPMLNYIGWINSTVVSSCAERGLTQDQCLTSYNTTYYQQTDLSQKWRSWPYQYCYEWGYFQTGSGVPEGQLPLISRVIDVEYSSVICKDAFNITTPPQVERINQWGGFNFSYPRLAIIDGQHDPWRQATPHAIGLPDRISTTDEPFLLIDFAVHHWDENGLFPNQTTATLPPAPIKDVQAQEVEFVKAWMKEWNQAQSKTKQRIDEGPLEL